VGFLPNLGGLFGAPDPGSLVPGIVATQGSGDWCSRYQNGGEIFDVEECRRCTQGADTYNELQCQDRRKEVFQAVTGINPGNWNDINSPINQAMLAFQRAKGRSYSQIKELGNWVVETGWTPGAISPPPPVTRSPGTQIPVAGSSSAFQIGAFGSIALLVLLLFVARRSL